MVLFGLAIPVGGELGWFKKSQFVSEALQAMGVWFRNLFLIHPDAWSCLHTLLIFFHTTLGPLVVT